MAGTFPIHIIGRIDGRRGFQTRGNVFRIGRNTFYDRNPMKNLEFKRIGIGLIAEFRGIPNGFPNQGSHPIEQTHSLDCMSDLSIVQVHHFYPH
jgi:hypothetical protein